MKLLVYVIGSPHKKYWKFGIHNCSNFGTGVSSIFGHVTCLANFKRADYRLHPNSNPNNLTEIQPLLSIYQKRVTTVCHMKVTKPFNIEHYQ